MLYSMSIETLIKDKDFISDTFEAIKKLIHNLEFQKEIYKFQAEHKEIAPKFYDAQAYYAEIDEILKKANSLFDCMKDAPSLKTLVGFHDFLTAYQKNQYVHWAWAHTIEAMRRTGDYQSYVRSLRQFDFSEPCILKSDFEMVYNPEFQNGNKSVEYGGGGTLISPKQGGNLFQYIYGDIIYDISDIYSAVAIHYHTFAPFLNTKSTILWHSHPINRAKPSHGDKSFSENSGIPLMTIGLENNQIKAELYVPESLYTGKLNSNNGSHNGITHKVKVLE